MQGKIPRNEYGNVEMFKPSMPPIGGAHHTSSVQSELCIGMHVCPMQGVRVQPAGTCGRCQFANAK